MRSGPQMGSAFSHPCIAPVTRFESNTWSKSLFFSAPHSFCNSARFFLLKRSDRHACSTRTKRSRQFAIESFRQDMGVRPRRSAARSPAPDCRPVAPCPQHMGDAERFADLAQSSCRGSVLLHRCHGQWAKGDLHGHCVYRRTWGAALGNPAMILR